MSDRISKSFFQSRRSFLKTSGLAAVSTALKTEAEAGAADDPETRRGHPEPATSRAIDRVNLLQGTDSTPDFSRGNTLPIAALPFGMAHWTLQSHDDTPWMFQPGTRRIQGLRCTHQLSPWLGDYGHATFLPFRGNIHPEATARASSYNPDHARLLPYSLQLFLLRYRAHVELVPTERCAVINAKFEAADDEESPGLIVDLPGHGSSFHQDDDHRTLRFSSSANAGGVPENFATYYVVSFPVRWTSVEIQQSGTHSIAVVRLPKSDVIEARIGTSFISFEQAERNLRQETSDTPITSLREAAAQKWEEHMQRIQIEGASPDQQRTFYSCMYRALLFPRMWHEPDAQGAMHHFSAFNGKVVPGVMYADHGYWDVYRAWYPFMSIVFPERLGEILQAWVNAYKEGGWLPQFPAPGYRSCMTGSLIDAVFGDAAAKGITGFDLAGAYEALKKHATTPGDPAKGYGRVGLEQYLKLNYIPADRVQQSVAETVDAALGDFCIAQVARALGKHDDYRMFLKRSDNWRNLFDPEVKFLRGKNEDGSWAAPFNPFTWGSPYVEGAAWQHRWDVPHDIEALIDLMGGKAESARALDQMLATPPVFHVGVYGREIHEMSEMAAVPFGQYAHSNQPVHHILYIYPHADRADRAQLWVRKVMQQLYTPDTFAGDEDTGSMSAWYILSALGFYPLCPGKPEYTLASPLFPRATLNLLNGKKFVVEAVGNSPEAVYVRNVSLDGRLFTNKILSHADLIQGGTLRVEMASST